MKNNHVIELIDKKRFSDLSEIELSSIGTHTIECNDCLRAFQAARISSLLLSAEPLQEFVPPAFFAKRVMANIRDTSSKVRPIFAFAKIWRADGILVALMITTVFGLIALTVAAPNRGQSAAADIDPIEYVILDEKMPTREPGADQVYQMVFESENNSGK